MILPLSNKNLHIRVVDQSGQYPRDKEHNKESISSCLILHIDGHLCQLKNIKVSIDYF